MMMSFKDFSVLSWNVRGFANRKSHTHMHEILSRFKPDFIFLSETHTRFEKSKRFWDREGYENVEIVEAEGQSGGLWAMRNLTSPFSFSVVECFSQCITIKVTRNTASWVFSGVYASPTISIREGLWNYLRELRARVCGGIFSQARASKFAQVMSDCDLLDLELFGSQFTWQDNCRGG